MAKVQVVSRVDRYTATLRKAIRDTRLLREVASFMRTRIYQYTKRGMSLATLRQRRGSGNKLVGDAKKLKGLSPLYIEYRKSLLKDQDKIAARGVFGKRSRKNSRKRALTKFGEFFSPSRSNLTLTGQMLDALKSDIDAVAGQATVYVDSTSRTDSELNNAEVAKKVAEEGRPFLGLDRVGRDRIRRMAIAHIRRSLKRR